MQLSKRVFLQAGGLALAPAVLALPARAQSQGTTLPDVSPEKVQSVHTDLVTATREATPGHDPWAADALKALINLMLELRIITEQEHDFLNRIIEAVITAENLDRLSDTIKQLNAELSNALTLLGKYVGVVVQSSIDSAKDLLRDADWDTVRKVILSDARGTLDGAMMGYRLYGVPGAIVGAAIGGGATSMPAFAAVA